MPPQSGQGRTKLDREALERALADLRKQLGLTPDETGAAVDVVSELDEQMRSAGTPGPFRQLQIGMSRAPFSAVAPPNRPTEIGIPRAPYSAVPQPAPYMGLQRSLGPTEIGIPREPFSAIGDGWLRDKDAAPAVAALRGGPYIGVPRAPNAALAPAQIGVPRAPYSALRPEDQPPTARRINTGRPTEIGVPRAPYSALDADGRPIDTRPLPPEPESSREQQILNAVSAAMQQSQVPERGAPTPVMAPRPTVTPTTGRMPTTEELLAQAGPRTNSRRAAEQQAIMQEVAALIAAEQKKKPTSPGLPSPPRQFMDTGKAAHGREPQSLPNRPLTPGIDLNVISNVRSGLPSVPPTARTAAPAARPARPARSSIVNEGTPSTPTGAEILDLNTPAIGGFDMKNFADFGVPNEESMGPVVNAPSQSAAMQQPNALPPYTPPGAAPKEIPAWKKALASIFNELPSAIASFTAAWADKPEIADNFLRERALRIEKAQKEAELEIDREKNEYAKAVKLFELRQGQANNRLQVQDRMSTLHNRLAKGELKDLESYAAATNLLANEYQSFGGNADDLMSGYPVPFADRIDSLRTDFSNYMKEHKQDPSALDAEAPFSDPYTGKKINGRQAAKILGLFNQAGGVQIALPDLTKVDSMQGGKPTTQYLPPWALQGRTFTPIPPPVQQSAPPWIVSRTEDPGGMASFTVVNPANPQQKYGPINLPIPATDIAARIAGFGSMDERTARNQAARALLKVSGVADPKQTEIDQFLSKPENQDAIAFLIKSQGTGVRPIR